MVSAHDVTAYILARQGPLTAMKLQKLVYYAQAWSLCWDEAPLFDEEIQAWANGPVVPELFREHEGIYTIQDWPKGDPSRLSPQQAETVDAVLDYYGDQSSQWLSDLTHSEAPWNAARTGLSANERGNRVITHDSMAWYYQGLTRDAEEKAAHAGV